MKRLYLPVAAVSLLFAGAAYAQSTTPAAPGTGSAGAAPSTSAPAPTEPSTTQTAPSTSTHTHRTHAATHKRMTFKQRFEQANTTHDGHLTKAQAEAGGLKGTARNFDAIDKDHKGYVTEQDIHAYYRARYAARRAAKSARPSTPAAAPTTAPAGAEPSQPAQQ
jgi:hypothetical protein